MRAYLLVSTVALCLLSVALNSSVADEPDALELLAQFDKAVARMDRVKCRLEMRFSSATNDDPTNPEGFTETLLGTKASTIVREAGQWRATHYTTARSPQDEAAEPSNDGLEQVLGKQFLEIQAPGAKPGKRTAEWPEALIFADLEPDASREAGIWNSMPWALLLFGRVPGADLQSLSTVFGEGETDAAPERQTINGFSVPLLTTQGRYGTVKVWLEPETACLPRRLEILKRHGDWYDSSQLGTAPPFPGGRGRNADAPPPPVKIETTIVVDNIELAAIQSAPMIRAFTYTETNRFDNGAARRDRFEVRIIDCEFPRGPFALDEFKPTIDLPDGTRVVVIRDPVAQYMWSDGQIRRRASVLEAAAPTSSRSPRVWIITANVAVLLLLLCGAVGLRMKRSRKG